MTMATIAKQTYLEDLEDAVPAIVVVSTLLAVLVLLGERVSDLNVGSLGHAGSSRSGAGIIAHRRSLSTERSD